MCEKQSFYLKISRAKVEKLHSHLVKFVIDLGNLLLVLCDSFDTFPMLHLNAELFLGHDYFVEFLSHRFVFALLVSLGGVDILFSSKRRHLVDSVCRFDCFCTH
uniref:Uncharacterized protein n=1 Tax=Spodoptera frugiperda nuclear polyhedrosis virus TaxID=10455 RepID=A0A7G3W7Y0_NPVSF|nr:hypothetical protein [Spodoptera frugiperda multiple nucleopolyhedrovirus]